MLDSSEDDIDRIREMFGGTPRDRSSRSNDRTSAKFYHQLVEYFYQRRGRWESAWRVCEDEYNQGKFNGESVFNVEELKPARAYSIVSTVESMVLANRPKFFLSGFTATTDENAVPVFEQALNNEWRDDFKLVSEVRLAIRDCAKYGVGIILSSYDTDYEVDTDEEEDKAEELRQLHQDDPILAAASSLVEAEIAAEEALGAPEELYETYEGDSRVVYNKVISRRVSPWDFLIDPDCTSVDDAKWMGRVILADLESVKADKTLKNTSGLRPTGAMDSNGRFRSRSRNADQNHLSPIDIVYLYELFIRRPSGEWDMCLLAEGSSDFLRMEKAPYWIGCPYEVLRWNQDGEQFFPQSDIQLVMSEIVAERLLLTKVFDGYARESLDITFYSEKAGITEDELYADSDPDVGKFVKVTDPSMNGMPIQNLFFKLPKDQKSPEAINLLAMIERSIQVSSGLGPNQFGQALKSGTSATEAAEVGSYAKGRGANKFSAVEEFTANIAKDRMGLMAQFYSASDIARIAGKQASEVWASIDWTKSDVQHGLFIGVEPGSTRQETEEGRINQLVTLMGIINQDPVLRTAVNIPEILKELFRLFGFNNGSKFLLIQDGVAFGNAAAEIDALNSGGRASTAAAGARGGSPPAVPGATGAQAAGGTYA